MQQRGEFGSCSVELQHIAHLDALISEAEAEALAFPAREMNFCLGEVFEQFFPKLHLRVGFSLVSRELSLDSRISRRRRSQGA